VQPHGNATLLQPPAAPPAVSRSAELPHRDFILENWRPAPKGRWFNPTVTPTFYTQKPGYGKVPRYLNRVKKESAYEAAYWQEMRESMMPEDTETRCRLLTEEEIIEILDGVQANLAGIKRRYGALSFGQDHISFRRRNLIWRLLKLTSPHTHAKMYILRIRKPQSFELADVTFSLNFGRARYISESRSWCIIAGKYPYYRDIKIGC
jgi:hypothetical protein